MFDFYGSFDNLPLSNEKIGMEARNVINDKFIRLNSSSIYVAEQSVSEPVLIYALTEKNEDTLNLFKKLSKKQSNFICNRLKIFYIPRILRIKLPNKTAIGNYSMELTRLKKIAKENNIVSVVNMEDRIKQDSVMIDMSYIFQMINKETIGRKYTMNKKIRETILNVYKTEFEKYPHYRNKVIYVKAPVLTGTPIKLNIMDSQMLKFFRPFVLFLEWFVNDTVGFKKWCTDNSITFLIEGVDGKMLALSGRNGYTEIEYFKPVQILKYIHMLDGKSESNVLEMVDEDTPVSDISAIMTDADVYENPSVVIDVDTEEDLPEGTVPNESDDEEENRSWTIDDDQSDEIVDEDEIDIPEEKAQIIAENDELSDDLAEIIMNEENNKTPEPEEKGSTTKIDYFDIVDNPSKSKEDKVNDILEIHNYTTLKKSVETPEIKKLRHKLTSKYGRDVKEVVKDVKNHQLEVEDFKLDPKSSYNTNKLMKLGTTYEKKLAKTDLENILLKPMEMTYPLLLDDKKETDISDRMFKGHRLDIKYKTHNGEDLEFSLDIPEVVDNKLFIGGSYKHITLQNAAKPVIKTDEDVIINTAYNKSMLSLKGRYPSLQGKELAMTIKRFSQTVNNVVKVKTTEELGDFIYNNLVSYNLIHLNRQFNGVITKDINIDFRGMAKYDKDDSLTILGKMHNRDVLHDPIKDIVIYDGTEYPTYEFINMMFDDINSEEWSNAKKLAVGKVTNSGTYVPYAKIMGRDIPVILLLWIAMPLTEILKRLETENNLQLRRLPLDDKTRKIKPKAGYGVLQLADRVIIMKYNNHLNELLLNYLTEMDLTKYDALDITNVMADYTGNANTALYIENFIELFIDPDTARICRLYGIPDDFVGIFIYAVSLFTTHITTFKNDSRNYRVLTSQEIINRCIYDVISKEFSDNAARMKRGSRPRFNIPRDAVIRRLQALPNMSEANPLSPFRVINNNSQITLKGHYGINVLRAYNMNTRAFNQNNFGTETMGTAYSGQAGVVKYLPFNPTINDLTGEYEHHDSPEGLNASNWSTFGESYVPYMLNDHIPRVIMFNGQTNHILPVEGADPMLVSSRADEAAIKMAPEFSYIAKGKGKITNISEKFVTIKYDDGSVDAISLENVVRNSDKGYYLKNDFVVDPKFKVGSTVKPDDVIAYSKTFYKKKGNGQIGLCAGALVWVVFCDSEATWEDSCLPFSDLADKLSTRIVKRVARVIDLNTEIRDWNVNIGQEVSPEDILFKYKILSDDESINELFAGAEELSLKEVDAHSKGKIVDIRVYYRRAQGVNMSNSIKSFVKAVNDIQRVKNHMMEIDNVTDEFKKAQLNGRVQLLERDKYSKINGDAIENGQMLIEYHIETLDKLGPADKIVVDRALKGEPTVVLDKSLRPTGERTGRKASLMSASVGFLGRMTGGMTLHGELLSILLHTACYNRWLLGIPAEEGTLLDYKSCEEMMK